MKIFFLCLAVACPLVLGTPQFWSLVRGTWKSEPAAEAAPGGAIY